MHQSVDDSCTMVFHVEGRFDQGDGIQCLGFIHNLVPAIAVKQRDALLHIPADAVALAGRQQVTRAFPANAVIQIPILRTAGARDGGGQVQDHITAGGCRSQRIGPQDVAQHGLHPHPFERLDLFRSPCNCPAPGGHARAGAAERFFP